MAIHAVPKLEIGAGSERLYENVNDARGHLGNHIYNKFLLHGGRVNQCDLEQLVQYMEINLIHQV